MTDSSEKRFQITIRSAFLEQNVIFYLRINNAFFLNNYTAMVYPTFKNFELKIFVRFYN